MGFRAHDPGLNQFDSRDMYDGATADMALTADPFTGSAYAFGDGNPITNIEQDGHCSNTADAICPGQTAAAIAAARKQEDTYNRNNADGYLESMVLFDNPKIAKSPIEVNQLTSAISGILQPGDPNYYVVKSARREAKYEITADCSGKLFRLGACPSEVGAAGTTPDEVKQSLTGAGLILSSAIPIGDILDAIGLGGVGRTAVGRLLSLFRRGAKDGLSGIAASRQAGITGEILAGINQARRCASRP